MYLFPSLAILDLEKQVTFLETEMSWGPDTYTNWLDAPFSVLVFLI
jgi:hypothetical protein